MFLLEVVMRGIAMGSVYALMGLGLTLIFGVLRIINFSQGEFYMLGGYTAYYLMGIAKLPWYIAIFGAMIVIFFVGIVVEFLLLSPIYKREKKVEKPMEYALIITFGLSIFFRKIAILIFGPFFKKPPDYLSFNISLPYLHMSGNMIVAIIASCFFIFITSIFISRTQRGRNWRAISQCLNGAKVVGVNVGKESLLAFGFSVALAAAAGAVIAPLFLLAPTMGSDPLIKGYEIIAIGGLGSIAGSLAGGIILGIAETLGTILISGEYRDLIGFVVLIIFLVFRPQGLFGQKS
mgnify:CR=1 FL=1